MAGLLGDSWEDPRSQGLLALAGGMLQGNMGAGVSAMSATMAGAQDVAMKRKLMDMQYQEAMIGLDQKQTNLARIKAIDGDLGTPNTPSTPAISPGAMSTQGGAGPVMSPEVYSQENAQLQSPAPAGQSGGLVAQARALGIPDNAIRTDLAFNGGKGIAKMIYDRGIPNMKVSNGFAYDENTVQSGFMPSLNTSANGQTSVTNIINGKPVVSAPAGAVSTFADYMDKSKMAEAKYDLVDIPDGKGGTQKMTRADAVNLLGGQGGSVAPSQVASGTPSSNNFGNIRPAGQSTGFATYATPEAGIKAVDDNLKAYGSKGINTISGIIGRWAPPSENDTPAYIKAVSQRLGISADQPLDMNNPAVRQALGTAITLHEKGPAAIFGGVNRTSAPKWGASLSEADKDAQAVDLAGNKASAEAGAKTGVDRIYVGYDNARTAVESLASSAEARKSIVGGVFSGAGAATQLSLSKAMKAMGFDVAQDKATNTDYLQSTLGQGILNKAKTLGANPTDNDARIIRDIVGSIGTDPQALNKLLDYQDVMANRSIASHNKNYKDATSKGFKAPFDLTVDLPKPSGVAPMDTLPKANPANKGKQIRDTVTGKILTSNGLTWAEAK